MADATGETAWRRNRAYIWVFGLLWILPAVVVAVGYLVLPKENPSGRCEGLGFGCTPNPADTLLLMGLMTSPVLFVAGVVAFLVIAIARRRAPS